MSQKTTLKTFLNQFVQVHADPFTYLRYMKSNIYY